MIRFFTLRKNWIRLIAASTCLVFSLVQFSVSVNAMSAAQRKLFQSNIHYFDVDACAPSATPEATTNISKVYLLGDSVFVGTYFDHGFLKEDMDAEGWTSQADASGGRGMSYKGSDPRGNLPGKNKSGLDAIKADADAIKESDTIVVELGTNMTNPDAGAQKSANLFKEEVEAAIESVREINKSVNIHWVTISAKSTQPYTPWVQEYNEVIRSVAAAKNFNVINAAGADISLSTDNIHPDKAGHKKLSRTIVDALKTSPAASSSATPATGQGPVYMVGDSITAGAKQDLEKAFGNADLNVKKINGDPGRAISKDTVGNDPTGLEAVRADAEQIKNSKVVVVALGTNSAVENLNIEIPKLIKAIRGAEGDEPVKIYWVNVFSQGSVPRSQINKDIKEQSEKNDFTIIDTVNADIAVEPSDDVHPTPAGQKTFAETVVQGVKNGVSTPQANTANSASGCACVMGDSGGPLSGKTNAHKAFNYLVGKGLSTKAASAVVGNLMLESGGNTENISTTIENADTGAHGIAQWAFGRKTELYKRGGQSDLTKQLEYLWWEISTPEGQSFAILRPPYTLYTGPMSDKSLLEILKSDMPLDQMTVAYEQIFERSGVLGTRVQNANKIFEKYGGGSGDSVSGGGEVSSGSDCNGSPEGSGVSTGDFIWPLEKQHPVTSCFGPRWGKNHDGLDIAAPRGTKVMAADGGKVILARNTDPGGYGKAVIIEHGDGFWTLYAHMNIVTVKQGQKVDQGQKVGEVNNSGSSQGDHLHFNIQKSGGEGQGADDPLKYLPKSPGRGVAGSNCPGSLG